MSDFPSPPRSFSSSSSSSLAAALADDTSPPTTPPTRTRALSDLLARYKEDSDDDEDAGLGGAGGGLSRNLSDPTNRGGGRKRVKLNDVDVSLLALDLGKWINANPSPQEAPLDPFFIPQHQHQHERHDLLPSLPITTTVSSSSHHHQTPSSSSTSSETSSPSTPTREEQEHEQEGKQHPPGEGPTGGGGGVIATWRGSPRGKVLIPKRAMREWDEGAEEADAEEMMRMGRLKL